MKNRAAILCLAAATCFAATSFASSVASKYSPHGGKGGHSVPLVTPNDSILYSNGSDDGVNAYTISTPYNVSDSFNLSTSSTLNSVTFSNWFIPGTGPGTSVDWAITTQLGGGTILASGTGALSNVFQGTNGLGADVYAATFSLGGVSLGAGTYYLDLGNEQAGGNPGYWGESGGPSVACQSSVGQCDIASIPSETFAISGNPNGPPPPPIPEPGSLVLLGTGLLGAAGAIRRKFNV